MVPAKFRSYLPVGGRLASLPLLEVGVRRGGKSLLQPRTVLLAQRPGRGGRLDKEQGVIDLGRNLFGEEVGRKWLRRTRRRRFAWLWAR